MMSPYELLDKFMLSLCVWREARGESYIGKRLVAQVILNRVRDKRWPNTIVGVITQKLQFSSFNSNDPNTILFPQDNDFSWLDCVRACEEVLNCKTSFSSANHYHTLNVGPAWADVDKIVATEGSHVFYQL